MFWFVFVIEYLIQSSLCRRDYGDYRQQLVQVHARVAVTYFNRFVLFVSRLTINLMILIIMMIDKLLYYLLYCDAVAAL